MSDADEPAFRYAFESWQNCGYFWALATVFIVGLSILLQPEDATRRDIPGLSVRP